MRSVRAGALWGLVGLGTVRAILACGSESDPAATPVVGDPRADGGGTTTTETDGSVAPPSGDAGAPGCGTEACGTSSALCGVHSGACGRFECGPCRFGSSVVGTGRNPAVDVSAPGEVGVAYVRGSQVTSSVHFATRSAAGTWTEETVAGPFEDNSSDIYQAHPRLERDPSGTLHLVFAAKEGSGLTVRHATRSGGTWTVETVGPGFGPDLAIDAQGAVHLAYLPLTCAGGSCPITYTKKAGAAWAPGPAIPNTGLTYSVGLALDPAGVPHAAFGNTPGVMNFAKLGAGAWTTETIPDVQNNGFVTTLDFAGTRPLVAFGSYLATRAASGTWTTTGIVTRTPASPGLVLGAAGQVHVVTLANNVGLSLTSQLDGDATWRTHPLSSLCERGSAGAAMGAGDAPRVAWSCHSNTLEDGTIRFFDPVAPYPANRTELCKTAAQTICKEACTCADAGGNEKCCYSFGAGRTCFTGSCSSLPGRICAEATAPASQVESCASGLAGAACGPTGDVTNPQMLVTPMTCRPDTPP